MDNYFERTYSIKWHDTDANRVCRPSPLLTYMQETANVQCREYGYDLDAVRDRQHLALILSSITMNFYEPLFTGDEIRVQTWCPTVRMASSLRCFRILKGETVIAEASSVWAVVDVGTHRLVRASVFNERYKSPTGEPLDPDKFPPRPHIPDGVKVRAVGERTVRYSDIDYNMHMNNTHYPDMVCDFLPDLNGKRVKSMSVAFRSEAAFGEILRAELTEQNGAYLLRTVRPNGDVNIEASVVLTDI